jgi:hypothetical protein
MPDNFKGIESWNILAYEEQITTLKNFILCSWRIFWSTKGVKN